MNRNLLKGADRRALRCSDLAAEALHGLAAECGSSPGLDRPWDQAEVDNPFPLANDAPSLRRAYPDLAFSVLTAAALLKRASTAAQERAVLAGQDRDAERSVWGALQPVGPGR